MRIFSSKAKVLMKLMPEHLIKALNIHAMLAATTMTWAGALRSRDLMHASLMAWLGSHSNSCWGKPPTTDC